MQNVHRSARADKVSVSPPSSPYDAQIAFAHGKESVSTQRACRCRSCRRCAAAWHRGRTFQQQYEQGLRPLDTARRLP